VGAIDLTNADDRYSPNHVSDDFRIGCKEHNMAIGVYFSPKSVNAQQYDEVMNQLNAAGASNPKGRSHHSAFGAAEHLMIFEVWDSQPDFEAFGAILMPILAKNSIDPGQPDIMPVHNIING
jgi:hypothetical protein